MSYVVYEVESTRRCRNPKTRKEFYSSERAAKAARTRLAKTRTYAGKELAVAETGHYDANIALMVERVNLMSGKPYMESINTPLSCSPASETYWSM